MKQPLRQLQVPGLQKQSQKQAQEKYFVRHITMHPHYRIILSSLREGVTASAIAKYFAEQGWLTVNERTFTEALRTFKSKHYSIIDGIAGEGLDAYVDPNRPPVDIVQQLQQLLRLQRQRLGMAHKFERDTNIPNGSLYKDIETTRALVETIGKLEGRITDGGSRRAGSEEPDVLENLNRIKRDQVTRDRLHTSVKQLVEQTT